MYRTLLTYVSHQLIVMAFGSSEIENVKITFFVGLSSGKLLANNLVIMFSIYLAKAFI
jgi:hypothetical protein